MSILTQADMLASVKLTEEGKTPYDFDEAFLRNVFRVVEKLHPTQIAVTKIPRNEA